MQTNWGFRGLRCGLILLVTLVLGACASTVVDPNAYRESPLQPADVMPTPEQAMGRRTKVVLLEVDDQAVRSRMHDAGVLKMRKLEEVLAEGGVEVIDRELSGRLRKEIALAELRGDGQDAYTGPELAEYAIRGFVSDVGATSRYVAGSEYCDKKGKCTFVPPSCSYSGSATGVIRVYDMPSLKLINTFNLRGSASSSTTGGCYGDRGILATVARSAVEDAVYDSRADLQNYFAPKGYVSEKRVRDKEIIFKVMLGRLQGLKPEDKVVFYTITRTENRLTRQVETTETVLGTGIVSNMIADGHAWVVAVEDAKLAATVRLGDYVRVQRKKGWFD